MSSSTIIPHYSYDGNLGTSQECVIHVLRNDSPASGLVCTQEAQSLYLTITPDDLDDLDDPDGFDVGSACCCDQSCYWTLAVVYYF